MKWVKLLGVLVIFQNTVFYSDGSFNFKPSFMLSLSPDLSERSSFIEWKKNKEEIQDLGHLELINLKGQKQINLPGINMEKDNLLLVPKINKTFQLDTSNSMANHFNDKNNNEATTDKSLFDWIQTVVGTTTTTTTPQPTTTPNPDDCQKCSCGLGSPPNRIVGGQEAAALQYPWVAILTYRGNFYCGAAVISDRYLLTAAHCVDRFDKTMIKVRLGVHKRNSSSESHRVEFRVENVIKHSGYSTNTFNNDIALIKIDGQIKFEGPMRPVCLPERGSTFAGKNATVTGWGAVSESGPISNTLQQVVVPIMTNAECRATRYPARRITDNMMCAGYVDGGKDSCQGDSGGPLHVIDENIYKVVGIVSWGEGCAVPGYPGVYARVNRYVTWIERHTRDSCYC